MKLTAISLLGIVLVAACNTEVLPQEVRTVLMHAELTSETVVDAPVDNRHFMPESDAGKSTHSFAGSIRIPEHPMRTNPEAIEPPELVGKVTQLFPGVTVSFVSHGDYLVPVERDLLAPPDNDSFWQIQFAPGRVWSEPGDRGMSRASFPFIISSNIESESYNGVATFLFDDKHVSELRYQVVQQLTPFLVETWFTAWEQIAVEFRPGAVDDKAVIAEFEAEKADRLVWRDWSELEAQHGKALLADFDSGIEADKVVASGLVIDNEVYLRSANTPYGPYPYPQEMVHGIWSATKTAAGLMTMLRMAQKYGDEIFDYKIADYVDVTAEHGGWENVTFANALSMATGIGTGTEELEPNDIFDGYIYSDYDEYEAWYLAPTLAEKIEHVFRVDNHPWGPGEHPRYRDRDTIILAAALDSLYRRKEGNNADLWGMMMKEVYAPIGIHHMAKNLTKETDRPGVPLLGWGQYTTVDDIAKISSLLLNGGVYNGEQLLSKAGLAEAMYQTDVRGLVIGQSNEFGAKTYHLSLWHENFTTDSGKTYSAPKMSGWGGIIVYLMPNNMIGFRFGNGGTKPLEQMIVIANEIRPFDDFGQPIE